MKKVFTVSILSLLLLSLCFGQEETVSEVDRIIEEFEKGSIETAEILALKALQREESFSRFERETIHLYLGYCYIAKGNRELAKRQFIKALELNPTLTLNPLFISPKISAVFDEARELFLKNKAERKSDLKNSSSMLRLSASWRSLVSPGWGHIYKGEKTKGYILIGANAAVLSTLAVLQWQCQESRQKYLDARIPSVIADKYDTYNMFYKARNITALLEAGLYIYCYLDCLYNESDLKSGNLTLIPSANGLTLLINF